MRSHAAKIRGWACRLALPAAIIAVGGQLALAGAAPAAHAARATGHRAGAVRPAPVNDLDCNGWSTTYKSANPGGRRLCADPRGKKTEYGSYRFYDNHHYVGHDEPSVKFISAVKGSGNTMRYVMRLPRDPKAAATANGTVTHYAELSVAPWFGLPLCDPRSYPQHPCKPDSDSNSGSISDPHSAGSAFMELQFYPPGNTPFTEFGSCSATQYCAALTIDSLACTFNFATCNNNCIEPVNFSYLQTDGVPPGPPAPQDPDVFTFLGNARTLKMNPGDVVIVSIADPPGGLTATIWDRTTHHAGWMQASAKNGFAGTSMADCSGVPFSFHAEYSTASVRNQVPWAALEGGVLMQQEIGHFESCAGLGGREGFSAHYAGGTSLVDPDVFQTCTGGLEGKGAKGEGPCDAATGTCRGAAAQGRHGPVSCPNQSAGTALCEYSDGYCAPGGQRHVTIDGRAATESFLVSGCYQNQYENGDLDFDGNSYRPDWPNGSKHFPQTFRYAGPFTRGKPYAHIQFETDAPGSEALCDVSTGAGCTAPPIGARFYPYWSMSRKQAIGDLVHRGACVWNFGNYDVKGTTRSAFGKDGQYGRPDLHRYGGTATSQVLPNPALRRGCAQVR